jgi:diguanylate cyclase (GGDEF)-like protein
MVRCANSSRRSTVREGAMMASCEERGVLAAAFYLVGGLVTMVAASAPDAHRGWLWTIGSSAIVVALGAVLARRRFGYSATLITSVLGPSLIALGIVAGAGGWASAMGASLYTFVAIHVALVLHRHHGAAVMLWGGVTAVAAAGVVAPRLPVAVLVANFVLVCGTLWAVTTWLVEDRRRQAATDPLTGLANRATFTAALAHARDTVQRTGEPLSLVALDLDGFKHLNDTRGHAAGDAALIAVGRAWRPELRDRDLLARTGGDEFVALLPGADAEEADRIARRLCEVMPAGTACSTGVSSWRQGQDLEAFVAEADRALYREKADRAEGSAPKVRAPRRRRAAAPAGDGHGQAAGWSDSRGTGRPP